MTFVGHTSNRCVFAGGTIQLKALDAFNSLYAERRKIRKPFEYEHVSIVQQFTYVSYFFLVF